MSNRTRFQIGAVLAVGLLMAAPCFAANPHATGAPPGGHPVTSAGVHRMPPHNFRGVPPAFHDTVPRPSVHGTLPRHPVVGIQRDRAVFHGHNFAHFTPTERWHWSHGHWRHVWHNGHFGWWWYADNFWFFYPAPVYPYPAYIGSVNYYDYNSEYGAPDYYWYYCSDPEGYYPYITNCNVAWEPVPPTPGLE